MDVAYAACLDKHGIRVHAVRTGGLSWVVGPGVPGPGSPQAVQRHCESVLPKRGLDKAPTPAQTARAGAAAALRRVYPRRRCSELPQSDLAGLRISPASGIDLNSPQFLAAQNSCGSQSPTLGRA